MPESSLPISPDVLVFVFTCFYLCQLYHHLYLSFRVLWSEYYTGIISGIQGLTWVLQILVMLLAFPNIRACISIFWVATASLPSSLNHPWWFFYFYQWFFYLLIFSTLLLFVRFFSSIWKLFAHRFAKTHLMFCLASSLFSCDGSIIQIFEIINYADI